MKLVRILTGVAVALITPAMVAAQGPPQGADCAEADSIVNHAAYVACEGAFGGNIGGSLSDLDGLFAGFLPDGTVWESVHKWDNLEIDNRIHVQQFGNIGPVSGWFVIGIKQATFYSFYLFNSADPLTSIKLDSRGTIAGVQQGFSHINLYRANVPTTTAPEPATVVLLGTALFGVGAVARRRRRS